MTESSKGLNQIPPPFKARETYQLHLSTLSAPSPLGVWTLEPLCHLQISPTASDLCPYFRKNNISIKIFPWLMKNTIIFPFPCSFPCVQVCTQSDDGTVKQSVRRILLLFSCSSVGEQNSRCSRWAPPRQPFSNFYPTMFMRPIILQLCIWTDPGGFKPCSRPMPERSPDGYWQKKGGKSFRCPAGSKKSSVMTERTTREPRVPGMPLEKRVASVLHS